MSAAEIGPPSPASGSTRDRLLLAAAFVPAAAYLVFVWHYAVNMPWQDDWFQTPVVSAALHGRLTLNDLWGQYTENRLVVPRLFFIAFGFVDHLNLRSVMAFSAVAFIATYALVLVMLRKYTQRKLTALPVFLLGIVWFSLVDVVNALWAFALAWYLVLLFLAVMICVLFVWPRNRAVALTLAILAATCASLSWQSGFLLWPVGLVGLLWIWTRQDKRYVEVAVWVAAGLLTTVLYLRGYKFGKGCIGPAKNCSVSANASHPAHLARYYLWLVGDVVGVGVRWNVVTVARWSPGYQQLLGAVIVVAAGFVVVVSLGERRRDSRLPLPLLLIAFTLLFDLMIALGRAGERLAAGNQERYTMPNVVLLVALVAFACAHPPRSRSSRVARDSVRVAFVALGILLLALTVFSTRHGVREARVLHARQVQSARIVVNIDRIPRAQRGCYVSRDVWNGTFRPAQALAELQSMGRHARHDRLTVFERGAFRKYRAQGPPESASASRADPCSAR